MTPNLLKKTDTEHHAMQNIFILVQDTVLKTSREAGKFSRKFHFDTNSKQNAKLLTNCCKAGLLILCSQQHISLCLVRIALYQNKCFCQRIVSNGTYQRGPSLNLRIRSGKNKILFLLCINSWLLQVSSQVTLTFQFRSGTPKTKKKFILLLTCRDSEFPEQTASELKNKYETMLLHKKFQTIL